ncbi:hypothetical protein AMTR_s00043p00159690 [Amborella trichopoda]|uniref:Uncharacterized protein n=2 Tax=Amborella trichopoda TaxID=13333 RepID=W1PRW4_AMBTC|nr:hypothetical protein AMTR_s00043p00159690 [Amborella trichopoda]
MKAVPPIPLTPPSSISRNEGPLSRVFKGCLGTLDANCIEKLLLHCGGALERNDITLAQQIMWVLNNVASSVGDPNQRLTSWFLRALISRASRVCPSAMNMEASLGAHVARVRSISVTQLAGYVDLLPWQSFGFCASNGAICKAIGSSQRVHILDISISHCMQWPTLIDSLSKRPEGAPLVRLTVPSTRPHVPPLLSMSYEEVGHRLSNFAKSRDVPFDFRMIPFEDLPNLRDGVKFHHELLMEQLNPSVLDLRDDEALVVNCQNSVHYLPDEALGIDPCYRDEFLERIRGFHPTIVTVVDEDYDLGHASLSSRISSCFNYLWIPFDALETFLPKDSCQRLEYEADIGFKIENIIAFEGLQRTERLESGTRLVQRMKKAQFYSVPFMEDTAKEVKRLLDEHASGWGMKRDDDMLVLTWKGHNAVFATAWAPQPFQ